MCIRDRRGTPDLDSPFHQGKGQFQGGLPPELQDYPFGLFRLVDIQNVFQGQRFKVQAIGDIVVGAYRFRVAVDHDHLVALLAEGEGGLYTTVIEFNSLADAVRSAAKDH